MAELPCPANAENGNCPYNSYCSGLQFLSRNDVIKEKELGPLIDEIPQEDFDNLIDTYCSEECLIIMESLRQCAELRPTALILLDRAVARIEERRKLLR